MRKRLLTPSSLLAGAAAGIIFSLLMFVFIPVTVRAKGRDAASAVLRQPGYEVVESGQTGDGLSVTLRDQTGREIKVARRRGTRGYALFARVKSGESIRFCESLDEIGYFESGGGHWTDYVRICPQKS